MKILGETLPSTEVKLARKTSLEETKKYKPLLDDLDA